MNEIQSQATFSFVELTSGEQFFTDTPYEAFRFAKQQELRKRNSVEYVAIGQFYDDQANERVYKGQHLRYILRSLDNVQGWLKAQLEAEHGDEDE